LEAGAAWLKGYKWEGTPVQTEVAAVDDGGSRGEGGDGDGDGGGIGVRVVDRGSEKSLKMPAGGGDGGSDWETTDEEDEGGGG
jgi:hypothetical protein